MTSNYPLDWEKSHNPKLYIDGVETSVRFASPIDPESVDRIEVVRGPYNLIWIWYGKYATGGETVGLAAVGPGTFRAVWADARSGITQLWTSPIAVRGAPAVNGSTALSSLQDVSARLYVEVTRWTLDGSSDTVSLVARLRNRSSDTIVGPLEARVVELTDNGPIFVANADNGLSGSGALWDVTSLLPQGRLAPGEVTGERVLRFRSPPRRTLTGGEFGEARETYQRQRGWVDLKMRLLAGGVRSD